MNLKKILLSLFIFVLTSTGFSQLENIAKDFVQKLSDGNFSEAVAFFDAILTTALPESKLRQTWNGLTRQVGPFQKQVAARRQGDEPSITVFVTCQFERSLLDVKVVFDSSEQISGLFFVPSQYKANSEVNNSLPDYVDKKMFSEKEINIGSEPWQLPGTLTLPNGEGPFSVVILVHGSGPHDRDETVGANKPFRDIAWGLASNGIAVLRYEKRTKQHAAQMASLLDTLTVQEETIDDVLAAIATMKKIPVINKQKIFVLGHSLGGMLIPRIAQQNQQAAGFIMMAGSTLPLEDSILNQYTYIFSLDGTIDENEKKQLDAVKQQVALIKSNDLKSLNRPVLGVRPAYWMDLHEYDPAKEASKIDRPILIVQGQRDYQVTINDYEGWKKALNDKDNVQFQLYPDLNHLFIAGEGKCTPAEYDKSGYVSETMINDIVHWISDM